MSVLRGLFGPPSKDQFAELMIAEAQKAGVAGEIRYDAAAFCLHIDGSSTHLLNLENAYEEYGKVPRKERQSVLRRYVGHLKAPDLPDSFDDVRPNLLPRIRQRSFYSATPLRLALPGKDLPKMPHRVFSEHLAVAVVLDFPDRISEMWEDPFEKWGVTFEEEIGIAADNLWERSKERFQELMPGFWQSPWRDNHDASRLYLTNLVRQLRVKGDHVAVVPNRDTLVITGSEDVEGLALMAALTEKEFEGGRAISAIPVTLDGDHWNPFMVSPEHPAFGTFSKLRYLTLIRDYEDQKSAQEEWNQKNGVDIFVASYTVYQNKETKALRSVGVWSEGATTLLPVTDTVTFMCADGEGQPKGEMIDAPWQRVLDVVGHRMKPQEMFPPRYLVESFPSQDQLLRLKEQN